MTLENELDHKPRIEFIRKVLVNTCRTAKHVISSQEKHRHSHLYAIKDPIVDITTGGTEILEVDMLITITFTSTTNKTLPGKKKCVDKGE